MELRRHSRWYRRIDRTHLHCCECDEGRSNRPNCDDTNEYLHLVIIKQVACLLRYRHHHEGTITRKARKASFNLMVKACHYRLKKPPS